MIFGSVPLTRGCRCVEEGAQLFVYYFLNALKKFVNFKNSIWRGPKCSLHQIQSQPWGHTEGLYVGTLTILLLDKFKYGTQGLLLKTSAAGLVNESGVRCQKLLGQLFTHTCRQREKHECLWNALKEPAATNSKQRPLPVWLDIAGH